MELPSEVPILSGSSPEWLPDQLVSAYVLPVEYSENVGSTVTGYLRDGSCSHAGSAVSTSAGAPPTVVIRYASAREDCGSPECGSMFASLMVAGGTALTSCP